MPFKIKPKLLIDYSWIYDKHIHEWQGLKYKKEIKDIKRIKKYKEKLQKEWKKIERNAFDSISKVSGLRWKKATIDCYLAENTHPFSIPLTIPMRKDMESLMETIMHELVHNIVVQNSDRIRKKKYNKKYGKLNRKTEIHILVHAILKGALIKVLGEKRTKEYIKKHDKWPDSSYKKAWDIVEEEGSKKIIKDLIKPKS